MGRPAGGARVVVVPALGEHAGDWDDLVDAAPLPSPFLRSWWLAHVPAVRPCFVLVIAAQGLLGGLALDRVTDGLLTRWRMLGAGPLAADHLDLVLRPGTEDQVLAALRRWLRRPGSHLLELEGLVEDARLLRILPGRVHEVTRTAAPFCLLPGGDPETYYQSRPGLLRSKINRPRKRLERRLGSYHRRVSHDRLGSSLSLLRDLFAERWGPDAALLSVWPAFCRAAVAGSAREEMQLHELVVPGRDGAAERVIAVDASFVIGDRVSFYVRGRSDERAWRGSGSLLLWMQMASMIRERGPCEFDFLRGHEDYKYDWAEAERNVLNVATGSGPLGVTVAVAQAGRRAARRRVPNRLVPALRRLRRAPDRVPPGNPSAAGDP